jgi:tetratricopeptide (TPR) repeat protein
MLAEEGLLGLGMAALIFMVTAKAAYQRMIALRDSSQSWRFIGVLSTLMGYFISAAIEQLWWPAFLIPVCLLAAYIFYQPAPGVNSPPISLPDPRPPTPATRLLEALLHHWRGWLPGIYLTLLLIFGATLIYVNSIAGRFEQLTKTVPPPQALAVVQEINQLQRFDPGLSMYSIAQGHYLGQHVIDTLGVAPCANPPATLPPVEKLNLEKAIRLYEQGLESIKAHPLYWANLAALYWLNHQPDKAQTALTQAVNLSNVSDPNIDLYLLNSGCYYELQGQTSAALTAYGRLVERNPALVNSVFWQASAFRAEHLPQIIDLASNHPADPQQQLLIAIELEWAQSHTEKAMQLIDTLAAAFPDSSETLRWQAKSLLNQGDYQESLALATKIEDYPLLGQIALQTGDFALAQTQLKKALFLQPDDPQARFQLAQVALAQGDQATAIAYLQRITSPYSPPTTADSRFIYGYSTHFSVYRSLLVITPPPLQGQPYKLLAQLYADSGDIDKAEEVRQALSTYDPYLKN